MKHSPLPQTKREIRLGKSWLGSLPPEERDAVNLWRIIKVGGG